MDWLQQTATGRKDTIHLHLAGQEGRDGADVGRGAVGEDRSGEGDAATGGTADEGVDGFNDEDTPLTWAEVWTGCLFILERLQLFSLLRQDNGTPPLRDTIGRLRTWSRKALENSLASRLRKLRSQGVDWSLGASPFFFS